MANLHSIGKRLTPRLGDHTLSVVLALAAAGLYLLTFTNGAYFTRDTLLYAQAVENGWGTFHPQHLAYIPIARLFYLLWALLSYTGRSLLPLQVLSALVGALNVGLMHEILSRVARRRAALAGTALFALSYGSWRYAVEANPYPMTLTGLLLVMLVLIQPGSHSAHQAVLAGMATALASLFTLSGALVAPAVLVAFWYRPEDQRARAGRVRLSAIYLAVMLLLLACAYVTVAVCTEGVRTPDDLVRYITRFVRGSSGWLGTGQPLSWRSLIKAVPGFANLFVGEVPLLRWLQGSARGWDLLFALSPAAVLVERGTAASGASWDVVLALLASGIVFAVIAAGVTWILRRWTLIRAASPYLTDTLTIWFVSFSLGALFWLPENVHYWLPNLIPICVMAAEAWSVERRGGERENRLMPLVWAMLVVCLTIANLAGSIMPLQKPLGNPYRAMALSFENHLRPGAAVVTLGAGEYRQAPTYLKYYLGCEAMSVRRMFIAPDDRRRSDYRAALVEMLDRAADRGAGAYLLSDLFDSELGYAQLSSWGHLSRGKIRAGIESLLAPWELEPVARHGERLTLYQMRPKPRASSRAAENKR